MTHAAAAPAKLTTLDDATRALVRLSATITGGSEDDVRASIAEALRVVPPVWVEELLLQTYLFAGFPRALNATREWRKISGRAASVQTTEAGSVELWRTRGERTCALVYGSMYRRLRENIRELDPSLDDWMIVEGYGKVLSRPQLDLPRRELCIVAACAAAGQDRQLLSHLHGCLNVGVPADVVSGAIDALESVLGDDRARSARLLWARVRGK